MQVSAEYFRDSDVWRLRVVCKCLPLAAVQWASLKFSRNAAAFKENPALQLNQSSYLSETCFVFRRIFFHFVATAVLFFNVPKSSGFTSLFL